jgi:hypothetical protein
MSIARALRFAVLPFVLAASALASLGACSSSTEVDVADAAADSGGGDGAVHDALGDARDGTSDAPVVCDYPPYANDPACPAQYAYTFGGKPCSPIGLQCAYPGAGDGESNGCFSTAMLWCRGDAGVTVDAGDAGDAGSGTWTAAQ